MLPHEKELVKRLEKEPFALLGLNSDGDAPTVRGILEQNQITWRQAILGSTKGELARRWNVQGWPTIYVVDAKGVIRYRDVRGDEMEKAVIRLISESKSGK